MKYKHLARDVSVRHLVSARSSRTVLPRDEMEATHLDLLSDALTDTAS
jgi:hypothetical protein